MFEHYSLPTKKQAGYFTGPIIKRNFKLPPADWIEVQVHGASADPGDIINGNLEERRLSAYIGGFLIRLDEATMK